MITGVRPAHWAASAILHGIVTVVLILVWPVPRQTPSLAIRFSAPETAQGNGTRDKPVQAPRAPSPHPIPSGFSSSASWKSLTKDRGEESPPNDDEGTAEDLLGALAKHRVNSAQKISWSQSDSEAPTAAPPTPPREWTPEGEVTWSLTLTIPASGGQPYGIEGLETDHPELDAWLGNWLGKQFYPPSNDDKPYKIRWTLTLKAVRPE